MAIGGIVVLAVMILGLLMVGLLVGGVVINRKHRREDAGRSADRVNGP